MSAAEEEEEMYDNVEPVLEQRQGFLDHTATVVQAEERSSEPETLYKRWQRHVKRVLNSPRFHVLIIVLIIADCLCVMGEIIIDYVDVSVAKNDAAHKLAVTSTPASATATAAAALLGVGHAIRRRSVHEHDSAEYASDEEHTIGSGNSSVVHHSTHHSLHHALEITEDVLKYISLSILGFFIIEILVKMIFTPKHFFKSKLEIMDAVVIVVSFVVCVVLVNIKHVIHSFASLLIIVRIWRITQIVNGFLVLEKGKHEAKIKVLEKELKALRKENETLRLELGGVRRAGDLSQLEHFDRL